MSPLDLIRALSEDGREHRYGVGSASLSGSMEELGALQDEPGPDRVPAWVTPDGVVLLGAPAPPFPAGRRSARVLAVLKALTHRGASWWVRTQQLATWRHERRRDYRQIATEAPSGYLYVVPGAGRIPLFEGVHPRTGDQLLTTDARQIEDEGYLGVRLVGYVDAPTGRTAARSSAPSRRSPVVTGWRPPCPGAHVDEPSAAAHVDRLPAFFRGYAMFPSQSVERIDVTVDGRVVGRARIGNPRPDIADQCACHGAPVSGWQFELGDSVTDVVSAGPVTLGGTVYGSAGETFPLPSRTVYVTPAAIAARRLAEEGPPPDAICAPPSEDWVLAELAGRRRARDHEDGPNVLVVTHSLTYGGAELYLAELLERLIRRGARFTVVAPADGPLRERLEQAGVTVHLFPQLGPWDRAAHDRRVAELTAFGATRDFDLVILNTLLVFYGVEVAARLGLPSIFAIHESIDPTAFWALMLDPHDPAVLDRLRAALGAASAVVFEAAATREMYLSYADPDRLITLPYGIDLTAIDRFRATVSREGARGALGIDPDATLVVCLGTIEPRKAQALLARAFARVAGEFPNAVLVLVGRREDEETARYANGVEEYLLRAGLLDRVQIRPLTPNPFEWHAAADILVCASDMESLPRVILEAMAFDELVVSTDIFGIPEVIEDGVTGFLCRSRDERAIADALRRALSGGTGHDRVRASAAARIREHHDADAYAHAFEALMDGLRAESSGVVLGRAGFPTT